MENLSEKIEDFTDELIEDLGHTHLPEEKRADIFAKVENHFNDLIVSTLDGEITPELLNRITSDLEKQDYESAAQKLHGREDLVKRLLDKIDSDFSSLKQNIIQQEKNAQNKK